jgi:hypothetical protein
VHWQNGIDRFDFDDYGFFDQQVDPIAGIDSHVAVDDGQLDLRRNSEPSGAQFKLQTLLIS